MKTEYKYIEVKEMISGKVVKRIDVSDRSDRQADVIESGMNRNMNHKDYFTIINRSKSELSEIH